MAELAVNGVHYNDDGTLNKVNYSDMWDSHMIRGCASPRPCCLPELPSYAPAVDASPGRQRAAQHPRRRRAAATSSRGISESLRASREPRIASRRLKTERETTHDLV